jgi:hypothetical protein
VEYFRIPRDVLTVCVGKSTYARCGLIVNVTPFEPEWEGYVTLEISNTTPLPAKVYANEGISQVLFFQSDEMCEVSYADKKGKYQGQQGLTLPRLLVPRTTAQWREPNRRAACATSCPTTCGAAPTSSASSRASTSATGFEPLETPAVENLETLLGKYGDEGNQLIFKILKRGEHEASGQADLRLRYDLTVPLARVIAHHQAKLPRFFKRYQIQPVWRADRPARGRFREFYQCDGTRSARRRPAIEAELCAAVSDALVELGLHDFVIRLNHRSCWRRSSPRAACPPSCTAPRSWRWTNWTRSAPTASPTELRERGVRRRGCGVARCVQVGRHT